MFPLLGGLISAGSSLLGNLLSSTSQQENVAAQNAAIAQQNEANRLFSQQQTAQAQGIASDQFASSQAFAREQWTANLAQAARNEALQREFNTMGIRYRVADAKAAGLHPLYALGAPSMPAGGVMIGNVSGPGGMVVSPGSSAQHGPVGLGDTSMGRGLAAAGQDISRALMATQTQEQRTISALNVERAGLENDLIRSQIAKNVGQVGPPSPSGNDAMLEQAAATGARTNSRANPSVLDMAKDQPVERNISAPGAPYLEGAAIPRNTFARTPTGWEPVMAEHYKERVEDDWFKETLWNIQNHVLPTIGINRNPPPWSPPGGHYWSWSPYRQEWQYRSYPGNEPHYIRSSVRGGESFIGAP